jgi:hypothetical protein
MSTNAPSQELNDLLVTRNFEVDALDASTGKPPVGENGSIDIAQADMFTFDYVGESGQNYGTVVIMLGSDNQFTVFFGDNVGRSMEREDKDGWYRFLEQLRMFAKRNLMRFDLQNLNRLKYTMQGMAAIREGLFESYTGTRHVSYTGTATEARLMIKHSRRLEETDARHQHIACLFIETADHERFRLPFIKLAGGRAMLEHVRQGGRPYDARGQHITQMVEQISVLSQFRRAHRGRVFEGAAATLVLETEQFYESLRKTLKAVQNSRGYLSYFESWAPTDISETELVVEDIKNLFVEQTVDPRILQALPVLAQVQEGIKMKEADIFEAWATHITEGTWSRPDTPEKLQRLRDFMSQPQPVGPDAANATMQLGDILGNDSLFDMLASDAEQDPESDARDTVRYWIDTVANRDPEIAQLRDELASESDADAEPVSEVQISQEPDAAVVDPNTDQFNEDAALVRLKSLISSVRQ